MSMKTFFRYFFGTLLLPWKAFRRLKDDPRPLRRGFQAVFLAGILSSITAAALALTGAVPMAPVFLPFQTENYYFWQMTFSLPLLLFVWVLTSAVVHILGHGGRKGGSFRKTLSLFGFALACPAVLVWIPQTVIAVFYGLGMGQQEMVDILSEPGQWQVIYLAFFAAAFIYSLILVSMAAMVSQNVRWWKGWLLGLIAETFFITTAVLFLR